MTDQTSEDSIESLRARIAELERVAADLRRHNDELRVTIAALMAPPGGKPDGAEA